MNKTIKKISLSLLLSIGTLSYLDNTTKYIAVNASEDNILNPIIKYEFKDGALGKDSQGNYDLTEVGTLTRGEKGVILNGSSYLYSKPLGKLDVTDQLDSFTITMWAKEDAIGQAHRFMLGTGVAHSTTGFGMGFYQTNSAYILPCGGADGYASNFVTSAADTFGPYATDYASSTQWNLFSVKFTNGTSYLGVNGHYYPLNISVDMNKIKNDTQTLTIGGICANSGGSFYNGFKGEIADVRIYNDLLTEDEFATMHTNGIGGAEVIVRNTKINSILNSGSQDETNEAYPNDFLVTTGNPIDEASALSALNNFKVQVKLADDSTVDAKVIYNKVTVNSSKEAIVEGMAMVNGSNVKNISIKVIKEGAAEIRTNSTFTNNMVLQRNKKVKIFGYGGDVGESVTVSFNGQTKTCQITDNGWEVYLDEMTANKVGSNLVITCGDQVITYTDVVVGEVLLCSGQSNMNITLQYIYNKDNSVLDVDQYKKFRNYDMIRVLDLPYGDASTPTIYDSPRANWKVCNTLNESMQYSAYALAAASSYQAVLGDVPVGIITASVGGSCIEEWIDPTSMEDLWSYAGSMGKVDSRYYNSFIYNLGGYSLGAILWYQGEANSQPTMVNNYIRQFTAYAKHYRELFEDSNLPIIVQQLVQFDNWVPTGDMRQAQWDFMKNIDNVYTVCGIDTGSMEPTDGIHPTDKWVLGERVAGLLAYINGIAEENMKVEVPYGISPEILTAELNKETSKIILTTTADGKLSAKNNDNITGFKVKVGTAWKDVPAKIVDGKIVLTVEDENITNIRYNYDNGWENKSDFIYNDQQLPLAPVMSLKVTEVEEVIPPIDTPSDVPSTSDTPSVDISDVPSNPVTEPSEEPKKGCKGAATTSIIAVAGLATLLTLNKKRRK